MVKALGVILILALVGCETMPQGPSSSSAPNCASASSYQCQVDMYMKAGG
jgi:hypothetical protein